MLAREDPSEHAPAHLDGYHDGEDAHDHVVPFDDAARWPRSASSCIVEEDAQGDHEQNDVTAEGRWRGERSRAGKERNVRMPVKKMYSDR